NPITIPVLINTLRDNFDLALHHSVSITGGEPLLQVEFLKGLLPALRSLGIKIYLETNGTLPGNLGSIIGLTDIISMDIKLPKTSGCEPQWDKHLEFLSIARQGQVFVKIVLDDHSDFLEYNTAVDLIARVDSGILLVIQPVTLDGKCILTPKRALEYQSAALKRLKEVRIIPQAHVMMNQL
ncbi:MAG: 7-carboxy-7-deazaguanine synthase QueE, partial [Desulfocucumaceae bacterium]